MLVLTNNRQQQYRRQEHGRVRSAQDRSQSAEWASRRLEEQRQEEEEDVSRNSIHYGGKGGKQSVDQPRDTNLGCSFYPLGRDCGFNKAGGGTCGTKLPGTGE